MPSSTFRPTQNHNLASMIKLLAIEALGDSRDIFIPMEVDDEDNVTDIFILGDKGFPEGGQTTILEYVGIQFNEGSIRPAIHRELDNQSLQKGYILTLLKLARSIDLADLHTRAHGPRTSVLSRFLAQEMGLNLTAVEQISLAGLLHDVGKVVVPKSLLTKPGRLTEAEWMIMRRHPTFAAMIMEPCDELDEIISIVQSHHEYFDGSGYPKNRSGDQIPIGARIVTLADSFTTMIEGRVYQKAISVPEALEEIKRCTQNQFDPRVVRAAMCLIARGEIDDILFCRNWRNDLPIQPKLIK